MTIEDLNQDSFNTGRWVAYRPAGQPHVTDTGRIIRWNDTYVWVVFCGPRKHFDPLGQRTPKACLPETLSFIQIRPDGGFDEL